MSTIEEKREKNRAKVARWRKKHAARLAAEQAERKRNRVEGRAYAPTLYRLIELCDKVGIPRQCLIVKEGQAYVIPPNMHHERVLLPLSPMTREEARAWRRMWKATIDSWNRAA